MSEDKNNKDKELSSAAKGCLGVLAAFIVLVVIGSLSPPNDSAEDLEKKLKGFHCLSAWDGGHRGFEQLIKQRLNDPNSMETLETRIAPVSDGSHAIHVSYTAKNAFGGRVRNTALGLIDHDTCEATILLKVD